MYIKAFHRILAFALVLALCLGIMPNVFAAEPGFSDVDANQYYYAPITWALENGITNGTSATTFSPERTCTREQVVTFLWRACGSPEPESMENPFKDIFSGTHYHKAVLWAVENGITTGTSATSFSPNRSCTRDQVVTFLWRSQGQPIPMTTTNPFTDIIMDYSYEAVLWAVENGITTGTTPTTFGPQKTCTRAQIVTFLNRAMVPEERPQPSVKPLTIKTQPQGGSVEAGKTLTLQVTAEGGTAPYTYQWMTGGTQIPGASQAAYTTGTAGAYSCVITDQTGKTVTSAPALVTITVPEGGALAVTQQPVGGEIAKGSALPLTVLVAGGKAPYSYQWYKDGTPIAGAYTLSYVASQAGSYFCAITDASGKSVISSNALVTMAGEKYQIRYELYGGDSYLQKVGVTNANPDQYASESGLKLLNLTAKGYRFDGWYDGEGDNAVQVKEIPQGETGDIELYAHWTPIVYKINFDSPLDEIPSKTYTINEGATLPNPKWYRYTFTGWADEEGNLVKEVSKGTTGNITLYANWTSQRNQTVPVRDLGTPLIHEDQENAQLSFVYEIGRIENVPLYTIRDFGYNSGEGITWSETVTNSGSISEESAEEIAKMISNATTNSSSWTLSEDWNKTVEISETHANEVSAEMTAAASVAREKTGTWNIGGSYGGSNTNTVEKGVSGKISGKKSGSTSINIPLVVATVDANKGYEVGGEIGGSYTNTEESSRNWNTNYGYEQSNSVSSNRSISSSLGAKISSEYGYGETSSSGGSESVTNELATTQTDSREYSSSFTYSTEKTETVSKTYTNEGAVAGYYRNVAVATVHVFAVVTYDIASSSYFVYTYNVMDDEISEFLDYSASTSGYDDQDNGVLPFEVPYFVNTYVNTKVLATQGLEVNIDTGRITGYHGTATHVMIPEYKTVNNGDGTTTVVRITGFESGVFAGNTKIQEVKLPNTITEIPAAAFSGCSALKKVIAPSVTSIGVEAFQGCSSLEEFTVSEQVTKLAKNAFTDAPKLTVYAASAAIAEAAIYSGAKNIVVNLAGMEDKLENQTFVIPETTESFTFHGATKTYQGIRIISEAKETVINGASFEGCEGTPLDLSSEKVTLNRVNVEASGLALQLRGEDVTLSLYGNVNLNTSGSNGMLCNSIHLALADENVSSRLKLSGDLLVCGSLEGEEYLSLVDGEIIYCESGSFYVSFDPNGGTVAESSRVVPCGQVIGTLPVPKRDFHTFVGWFTEPDGGTQVLADSTNATATSLTLYAHWKLSELSDWVLASELPANAQVVNSKWTYTQTITTQSTAASLEGYTQIGSQWVASGSGSQKYSTSFPSGFNTSNSIYTSMAKSPYTAFENATNKREVSNKFAGYVYWHWMYNCGGASAYNRRPFYQSGYNAENGYGYNNFSAFTSTKDYGTVNHSGQSGWTWYLIQDSHTSYAQSGGSYYWYRFNYYTSSYTDYYKLFTYSKVETMESTTEVAPSETVSNVKKWVQYREV